MRTMRILLVLGLAGAAARAALPPASISMVPAYINYQGRLTQPNGAPYSNVNHRVQLRLYATAGGGTALWGEEYTSRTQDGYFSILMGSGGTPLPGSTNELWKVLWSEGGSSPNTFFMGLTVLTDPVGNNLVTPQEASPRQQFLATPFAIRALQSQYANQALDEFQAPAGIRTPQITGTTDVIVTRSMRITGSGNALYTSRIFANDSSDLEILGRPSKVLEISADNSSLYLGTATPSGLPTYYSSYVQLGHSSSTGGSTTVVYGDTVSLYARAQSTLTVNTDGGTMRLGYNPSRIVGGQLIPAYGPSNMVVGLSTTDLNIQTDNLSVNSQPIFKFAKVIHSVNDGSFTDVDVTSSVNEADYDIMVVGWSASVPPVGVYPRANGIIRIQYEGFTDFSLGYVWVLGVRKGLIDNFAY